jgi:hypothetical protein
MAETLTIQFKATGGAALKKTIDTIYAANVRLTKGQKEYEKVVNKLNSTNKKLENSQKRLRRSTSTLTKEQKKAQAGLLGLGHSARNTSGAFSVLRSQMLLASFGAALVVKPLIDIANAASRADEQINKASVVFGHNISVVTRWASALGESIGRADSTLIAMASTLQDTFVPLGFSRDAATKLSTSLTQLALDVASFNDKADADVIRDFQSAIVGNHETVRKYGIVITEAALKQEAMVLGISKGSGELTNAAKVQARLSLIMKGSADAMGDLDRTQDEYANTVKRFNEHWKEVAETLGKDIQPILKAFMNLMMDTQSLKAYALALGFVGGGYLAVSINALTAAKALKFFKSAMIRTGVGALAVGLGYLADKFLMGRKPANDLTEELKDSKAAIDDLGDGIDITSKILTNFTEAQQDSINSLQTRLDLLYATSESERILINLASKREGGMSDVTQAEINLAEAIESRKKSIERTQEANKKELELSTALIRSIGERMQKYRDDAAIKEKIAKIDLETFRQRKRAIKLSEGEVVAKEIEMNTIKSALDTKKLSLANDKLTAQQKEDLTDSIWELSFGYGILKSEVEFYTEEHNKADQSITDIKANIKSYIEIINSNVAALKTLTATQETTFETSRISSMMTSIGDALGGTSFDMSGMIDNFHNTLEVIEVNGELVAQNTSEAFQQMAVEIGVAMIQAQVAASQAKMASIKADAQADIEAFKKTERYNKMSTKQKKAFEAEKLRVGNAAMKKEFESQQKMQRAGVVMNTAAAIMQIWASPTMGVDPVTKGVLTAFVAALSLMQLEAINSQSAPTMAKGGMIGGKLHVQGGTMVNAERGEYIMSRAAVDAVGVETMNRINQGGGGAAINVSFTGNVMSDEFLESEAIPKIKEAIRRGADIGVS